MASNYINVWYVYKKSLPSITYYAVKIEQPAGTVNGPLRDYSYLIRQKIFEYLSINPGNKTYSQIKNNSQTALSSKFVFQDDELQKALLKLYINNAIILTNSVKGSIKDVYSDTSYVNSTVHDYLVDVNTRYQVNLEISFYEDDYLGNFDYSVGEVTMTQPSDLGIVTSILTYVYDLSYDTDQYNPRGFRYTGSLPSLYIGEGQTSTNDGSAVINATYTRSGNVVTVTSPVDLETDLVGKKIYLEFTSNVYITASYIRSGTSVTVTLTGHKYPENAAITLIYSDEIRRSYRVNDGPSENTFTVTDYTNDIEALAFNGGELRIQKPFYIEPPPVGEYDVASQDTRKKFTITDPSMTPDDSTYNISVPAVVIIRKNFADVSYISFQLNSPVEVKRLLPKLNPNWDPAISNQQIDLTATLPKIPNVPEKINAPTQRDSSRAKFELDPITKAPIMLYYSPTPSVQRTEHVIKVYGSLERALQEARLMVNTSSVNGEQIEAQVGTYYRYHPNGYESQIYTYKLIDGLSFPIGPFIEYHPNGQLRCQGNFSLTNENRNCLFVVEPESNFVTLLNLTDHIIKPKDAIRFVTNNITLNLKVKNTGPSSLIFNIPYNLEPPTSGTATLLYSIRLMGKFIPISITCNFITDNMNKKLSLTGIIYPVITYPKNSKRLAKVPRIIGDEVKIVINTATIILQVESIPSSSSIGIKLPDVISLPTDPSPGSGKVTTYSSVIDGQYSEFFSSGANKSRCNIVRGRVQGDIYQWDEEGNREYVVLGIEDGTFTENTVVLNYTFTY